MSAKGGAGAEAISINTRVLLPLRWIAGASWADLVGRFGVSRSTVYTLLWDFASAVNVRTIAWSIHQFIVEI